MLVVGLTGGIASGKTTVSRMFSEAGIPVICADELARKAVEPGSPALEEIRRAFGADVIDEDGGLDRARMADLVFNNPELRRKLESIIHPRVEQEKNTLLMELEKLGHKIAIVDVPLLYETGWDKRFKLVIVVYVPRETQIARLIGRDGMSEAEALARIAAQMDIEEKKRRSDKIVDNSGDLTSTLNQIHGIIRALRLSQT
jgi:dephospho-CoA kinase